ncbi:MAG: isoaspartyl peptidase/L-asparaginase [Bacteroidota bacterium]
MIKLIVHGGAWDIPTAQEAAHLAGVETAIATAWPVLEKGGTALDAVEVAVRSLEADSTFDAGRGAFLNSRGEIELDAMIMDGASLDFGSVAAVQNLLHPVSLARRLMESEEFRMLVGTGAQIFAEEQGFEKLPSEALLTERELAYFKSIKNKDGFRSHHPFGTQPSDTVGAVALDQFGNIAAATSTGGTPRKWPGRVGDSPIPGAGAYADNDHGGASTTGWGESIMKVLLAKTMIDQLAAGYKAPHAAQRAIQRLAQRVKGLGGVITIAKNGDYGWAYNTPKMAFAYMDTEEKTIKSSIKRDDS